MPSTLWTSLRRTLENWRNNHSSSSGCCFQLGICCCCWCLGPWRKREEAWNCWAVAGRVMPRATVPIRPVGNLNSWQRMEAFGEVSAILSETGSSEESMLEHLPKSDQSHLKKSARITTPWFWCFGISEKYGHGCPGFSGRRAFFRKDDFGSPSGLLRPVSSFFCHRCLQSLYSPLWPLRLTVFRDDQRRGYCWLPLSPGGWASSCHSLLY